MLLGAHLSATSSFDIKEESDVLSCHSARVVLNREIFATASATEQKIAPAVEWPLRVDSGHSRLTAIDPKPPFASDNYQQEQSGVQDCRDVSRSLTHKYIGQ